MKKKTKAILISLLLLVSGLFIFNSQPVQAASNKLAGTTAGAKKLVKTYHLKKATVPKKFRGYWYNGSIENGRIKNEKLYIAPNYMRDDLFTKYKKIPFYKTTKTLNEKMKAGKVPLNKHMLLVSSKKNELRMAYPGQNNFHGYLFAGVNLEVYTFGHEHGHQVLHSDTLMDSAYYRTKKLTNKYNVNDY